MPAPLSTQERAMQVVRLVAEPSMASGASKHSWLEDMVCRTLFGVQDTGDPRDEVGTPLFVTCGGPLT